MKIKSKSSYHKSENTYRVGVEHSVLQHVANIFVLKIRWDLTVNLTVSLVLLYNVKYDIKSNGAVIFNVFCENGF